MAGSTREMVWCTAMLLVGIALTMIGSDWLVDGAVKPAQMMEVSEPGLK